jgi:hypothetical protein
MTRREQRQEMETWKRALIAGSAAVSAMCFVKGRPGGGLLFMGISLTALASHYPERFRTIRAELPYYMDRGLTVLEIASRVGEHLADANQRRHREWYDALLRS